MKSSFPRVEINVHLAHLAASCAILLDARAAGRFEDDRARLDLSGIREEAEAVMAGWKAAEV